MHMLTLNSLTHTYTCVNRTKKIWCSGPLWHSITKLRVIAIYGSTLQPVRQVCLKARPDRKMLIFVCCVTGNPVLDGWMGARHWALSPKLAESSITRSEYQEMGEGYIREHHASNLYFPSPLAKPK